MDVRAQLTERLKRDRDQIIQMCQEIVRIPSENPPGDTTEVFNYVAHHFQARGLDYEPVAPVKEWPNLVATLEGGEPGKHLVLNGHLDVFPAGDASAWSADPFSGLLKDGKVFGRGVADMKAGTLASILAYTYLAEVKDHLRGKLSLTCVSDEETGGKWGTEYLLENFPDLLGDAVLNGEPGTPFTYRFGEKGPIFLELRVETKGGHGGNVQMSPNAIEIAAEILGELRSLRSFAVTMTEEVRDTIEAQRQIFDRMLGEGATDALGQVTVNYGVIRGGLKVNMIAPSCSVQIDLRCPIGVSNAELLARFEEILRRYPQATYSIINGNDPTMSDPFHELAMIVRTNGAEARGIRPVPALSLGGSDCRFWRMRGVPAFIYGPTPYNMAAPDEHVLVDDLLATVYVHTMSAFDYLTLQDEEG